MITKTDWDAALTAWIEDERERLGGPPSPEDVVAYLSGELAPAEAARVRALLVYYPELTPLLTERIEKPRVIAHRPRAMQVYAAAATLVIALLCTDALVQRHRNEQPAAFSSHYTFSPSLTRSGAGLTYELAADEERYLLTIIPIETPRNREHEVEIARESRVVWRADDVRPLDGAFVIEVPGRFLERGTYTLRVRDGEHLVARYTLHVTP
jgi:hypothetical protein